MKQIISTPKAPSAIGPYNQATAFDKLIFTSGQIALGAFGVEIIVFINYLYIYYFLTLYKLLTFYWEKKFKIFFYMTKCLLICP